MRNLKLMLLVPAAVLAAACGRSNGSNADDALKNDLALASQAQPYMPQQFMSPTEQGYAPQPYGYAPQNYQAVARQPVYAAPARRRSSSGGSYGRSSGGYYPAPAPTRTVKHTGRDAAIGAAAGAVLGATTSRDKIKGGIIGAAAGGILGAVIGNNVDVHRQPQY